MDTRTSRFGEPGSAVNVAQNNDFGNGRLIPQLFNSLPDLNGAASYFAETTSYLTSCFPDFSGQSTRADDARNDQEITPLVAEPMTESFSPGRVYLNRTSGLSASANATNGALHLHDDVRREAADISSENAGTSVQSTSTSTSQSGISLFQGLVERARKTVRGSADDIGWLQRDPDMPSVEDGTERFMEILDSIRPF